MGRAWSLIAFLTTTICHQCQCGAALGDQNWDSRFGLAPGFNGPVRALALAGTNLFVAGDFTKVGDVSAIHIARWDGQQWHALGEGIDYMVQCLAADGTNLYAGGLFNEPGANIARWDGRAWSSLGSGLAANPTSTFVDMNGRVLSVPAGVNALVVKNSRLYAGGAFYSDDNPAITNIAVWDGNEWQPLANDNSNVTFEPYGAIFTLAFHENELYAGGLFNGYGSAGSTNIARWDGSAWHPVGSGLVGDGFTHVTSLASIGERLLVSGSFFGADGTDSTNLIWRENSRWSTVSTAAAPEASRVLADGTGVILYGKFSSVGTVNAASIARFDGTNWAALGEGVLGEVTAAVWYGPDLVVGGSFQVAGGKSAGFLARWNGQRWMPFFVGQTGSLFGPRIDSISVASNGLYVSGELLSAGEVPVANVAHFNGTHWSSMPQGLEGNDPGVLASVGTNLYFLQRSRTNSFGSLKRWSGESWSPVALPATSQSHGNYITQMLAGNTNLYLAGDFKVNSPVAATSLLCWDGSQWKTLGYQLPNLWPPPSITALATREDVLFVAQHPNRTPPPPGPLPPPCPTNIFQMWDGSDWSDIGANLLYGSSSDSIRTMAWHGLNLFVGGNFIVTSPINATNLMRWDGALWHAVDLPFVPCFAITSLASNGTNLYAKGWFQGPYGGVAKWNGTNWSGLGSGLWRDDIGPITQPGSSSPGNSLELRSPEIVAMGREVFMRGDFTMAGQYSSYRLACFHEFPFVSLSSIGWLPNSGFGLRALGANGQPLTLQGSSDLATWNDITNFTPTSQVYEVEDPTASTQSKRYYRVLLKP